MEARALSEESVTELVPGASYNLAHLSDGELLANTRHLVGKSNQILAALLEHLAEVEARGIHRLRRCASLYTYCIYELRLSEDASSRRASAARLVKRFPALLHAIAVGELHLTGLLMLAPHLTEANHLEVMARAKFRTKKEIGKLIRVLAPLPQVPDRIEPLGPEPRKAPRNPTYEEFAASLCPVVRELPPGERPGDWANDTLGQSDTARSGAADAAVARMEGDASVDALAQVDADERPPLTEPQLYQMQFTTTEEHARLVERARALLSQGSERASLSELHVQAMRLLVAALESKRFGSPRRRGKAGTALASRESPRQRGEEDQVAVDAALPGQRSRYIPAVERRAVFERDGGRCSYVDERGERCHETHHLQIHHVLAFARGGASTAGNLALRCAAHNALAAEEDFGREHIERQRHSQRHEARAKAPDS